MLDIKALHLGFIYIYNVAMEHSKSQVNDKLKTPTQKVEHDQETNNRIQNTTQKIKMGNANPTKNRG